MVIPPESRDIRGFPYLDALHWVSSGSGEPNACSMRHAPHRRRYAASSSATTGDVDEPRGRWRGWPSKNPDLLSWHLGDLLDVAFTAGWMPDEFRGQYPTLEEGDLGNAASWLQWLRNLLHPGAFVRQLDEGIVLGEPAFANAYGILDAVYDRMGEVLDSFGDVEVARTVHTAVTPSEAETPISRQV